MKMLILSRQFILETLGRARDDFIIMAGDYKYNTVLNNDLDKMGALRARHMPVKNPRIY